MPAHNDSCMQRRRRAAPRSAAEEDTHRRGRCNPDQPERLIHPSNHDRLLPGNASPREVPPQQSPETGYCRRPRRHREPRASAAITSRRRGRHPPGAPAPPRPGRGTTWQVQRRNGETGRGSLRNPPSAPMTKVPRLCPAAGTAPERQDRARQPEQPRQRGRGGTWCRHRIPGTF